MVGLAIHLGISGKNKKRRMRHPSGMAMTGALAIAHLSSAQNPGMGHVVLPAGLMVVILEHPFTCIGNEGNQKDNFCLPAAWATGIH